jgi:maltose alpha-D-glucosyltransferase/alpha-amylase
MTWYKACSASSQFTPCVPLPSPLRQKIENPADVPRLLLSSPKIEARRAPIAPGRLDEPDALEELTLSDFEKANNNANNKGEQKLLRRLSMPGERDWYKDAVFYEVFVRAFKDSNGDGIGDLQGLRSKLGYLHDLGVTAIWLLPIAKSPLRDHGYDVSDYYTVHPDYGSIDDFRDLVREAHDRRIRIVVELVPNHTSCDHPWFQASRDHTHPDHDAFRDFYIWSDTDTPYALARVIFRDYEASNWTWDSTRRAFFYHRFFHHQPDLNYDNLDVQAAILDVIRFWVKQGVDAVRVDAPPYLFKREGTNCENLPETHEFFKRLRRLLDIEAPEIMLLSEANQWPQDVIKYFGQGGDEFDMNFHFPLMPRIYMAMAKHSRECIEHILSLTPPLPPGAQWGTFLRNHDELTLEMVTEEDREFMWNYYAPDKRMRLNLGIRRRLAPLLDNDHAKITLAHSILLTIMGSPFLYYGDEIGMGDNILLDDRAGVRTPMQWDDSRNAGFSTAPQEKIYLQSVSNGPFSYRNVNVVAQQQKKHSLFSWLRLALKIRRHHRVFGRGSFKLLDVPQKSILAYIRASTTEAVIVINNLSGNDDIVELDASTIFCACNSLAVAKSVAIIDLFASRKVASMTKQSKPLRLRVTKYGHVWLGLRMEK